MSKTAEYIRLAKAALGNASMSDRELGEHFGTTSQVISQAARGKMSDPLAIKVARLIGIDAGELINVARVEREQDPEVRSALESWLAKTLAAVPSTVTLRRDGMAAVTDQLTTARPRRRAAVLAAFALSAGLAGVSPDTAQAAVTTGPNAEALCIM